MIKMNVNQADYLIPKEDYDELFRDYIELTLKNERLQNNWNELNKFVEEKMSVYEHKEASNFYVVFEKMQELQGDDKN